MEQDSHLAGDESASPVGTEADEFETKVVYWTSGVVNACLEAVFPASARAEAAILLSALVGEDPGGDADVSDAASCRLMLAALKVCAGDLTRLSLWVDAARSDPRDLIAAAEYPRQLQENSDQARSADQAEYVGWLTRSTS